MTKSVDFYGRGVNPDAPPGPLEVASGDVGPVGAKPALVWVGFIVILVVVRLLLEMAE